MAEANDQTERFRPSLVSLIRSDIASYARNGAAFQRQRAGLLRQISILTIPSVACCMLYRLAHLAHSRGRTRIADAITALNLFMFRAFFDPASRIGPGMYVPHPSGVVFRGAAGRNLILYTNGIVGAKDGRAPLTQCPRLGDDVTAGACSIVLGPIEVGDDVKLGPGVMVTENVPAHATLIASHFLVGRRRAAVRRN